MENRREFLKRAGAAAIGATIAPGVAHGHAGGATPGDGPGKDLLMTVLQAARYAGARTPTRGSAAIAASRLPRANGR